MQHLPLPPATSTWPLGSRVAVWSTRAVLIEPVGDQVPLLAWATGPGLTSSTSPTSSRRATMKQTRQWSCLRGMLAFCRLVATNGSSPFSRPAADLGEGRAGGNENKDGNNETHKDNTSRQTVEQRRRVCILGFLSYAPSGSGSLHPLDGTVLLSSVADAHPKMEAQGVIKELSSSYHVVARTIVAGVLCSGRDRGVRLVKVELVS